MKQAPVSKPTMPYWNMQSILTSQMPHEEILMFMQDKDWPIWPQWRYVWKSKGEGFKPKNTVPAVEHGGGSFMGGSVLMPAKWMQ